MRNVLMILVAALTLFAVGCSDGGGGARYPLGVEDAFRDECQTVAESIGGDEDYASAYCQCILEWFEARWPVEKFMQVDAHIRFTAEFPPEFEDAAAACNLELLQHSAAQPSPDHDSPTTQELVDNCVGKGNSPAFCSCVVSGLINRFGYEQAMSTIQRVFYDGQEPPLDFELGFYGVVGECAP
jgi:hypothetical protein